MNRRHADEDELLLARLDDLCEKGRRGEVACSAFLSPRACHEASAYLDRTGMGGRYLLSGGYDAAERRKLIVLPDYMEGVCDPKELSDYGEDDGIGAVNVMGSGYRALSHRDYLGALLALGVEREVLGDILPFSDGQIGARIFCEARMVPFFCDMLTHVGADAVRVCLVNTDEPFAYERQFRPITDTVASPRLDGVVAALCSLSRDKAASLVDMGAVEIDYEVEQRRDRMLCAPCTVTVRGCGKFRIQSLSDKTKKGRLRLNAEQYQ